MSKNSLKNAAKKAAPDVKLTPAMIDEVAAKHGGDYPKARDPNEATRQEEIRARAEVLAPPPTTPRPFRETATAVRKALAAAAREPGHALADVRCEVRRSRLPSEPGTVSRPALLVATSVEPTPKIIKALDLVLESFGAPRGGPVTRLSPSPEIPGVDTEATEGD